MSQVAKAIVATDTGERKILPKGLSPLFVDVFKPRADIGEAFSAVDLDHAIRYRIGVTIGADCMVAEHARLQDPSALQKAINRTKSQVIEGIFGEFRPHLRRIEKAIYDYNYEEAGRLLHEMERVMFDEYE